MLAMTGFVELGAAHTTRADSVPTLATMIMALTKIRANAIATADLSGRLLPARLRPASIPPPYSTGTASPPADQFTMRAIHCFISLLTSVS
jgi:hypothetical protein